MSRFVAQINKAVDWIDERLWPWAQWADSHGVPEMFWGPREFWWCVSRPRLLWWNFREHWFDPQAECIDYIDGYCVGYYDMPSRFMWGVYAVRSWVDPRYWYYRWRGWLP